VSLRRRLVVGMLLLLVVGIGVTDVATRLTLRSFLYGRLDEQVDVAQSAAYTYIETVYTHARQAGDHLATTDLTAWLAQLSQAPATPNPAQSADAADVTPPPVTRGRPLGTALSARVSPDIYIEVLGPRGHVVYKRPSGLNAPLDPAPVLPKHVAILHAAPPVRFGTSHGVYLPDQPSFTATAVGASGPYYRGEALAVPGGTLVTAIPLGPTVSTLRSLTRVEAVVSAVVLVAMLLLVLWIVRLGLRPLDEMTETARAIAGGDMRRRVRPSDPAGEVGRLGTALNGMLSQIEAAFAERQTSETRLRRFVADASHELRTPLTSIRGYAELLRKGALPDEAAERRAAERIEHEAARMGVLVDDLLLLARLDQGRPLERERVDLARVAGDAVDAARAADAEHPVDQDLEAGAIVHGDVMRLRQVVDNLLANAAVHTPAGTPVRVRVARRGDWVDLEVADEGPGLAPEQVERVFDRFYRGAEARRRPGTGLGLSIVAALAEAHGGHAEVTAEPGGGSRFLVVLPAAADGPALPDGQRGSNDQSADPAGPTDQAPGASAPGTGPDDGNIGSDGPTLGTPARR